MHSNDNVSCVRRQLLKKLKAGGTITSINNAFNIKMDIFPGSNIDLTTILDDNKLLGELPFRDKLVIFHKINYNELCIINYRDILVYKFKNIFSVS